MSSSDTPAILGGTPVRGPGFRTTPEVGQREIEYVRAQILTGDWEPDAARGGMPVAAGLTRPANVAEALGFESAALAAELAWMQAPGQEVHFVPLDNGTQAIKLALAAIARWAPELGLREHVGGHSEVLVPSATWQATAGAALRRNLVPVLVDVLPGTLCMDPEAMRAAITDRTVGVIPVHLYDRMAPMSEILAITAPLGIAVIEDCAHAHGARYRGQGAGTIGDVGTFSDQGSKTLASQEGGFAVTKEQRLADQLCSLVTCGRQVGVSRRMQADNDRMPGAVAALLRAQLLRFPEQNELRVRNFAEFDRMIRGTAMAELGLRVSDPQPEVEVPPTYKKVVRVDLTRWGGMTLRQWMRSMAAELACEITPTYEPLVDSPLYDPHSDPALKISDGFWTRIDPRRYQAPVAVEAHASVAAIGHAAFLDDTFAEKFAEAAAKTYANRDRLAREVTGG